MSVEDGWSFFLAEVVWLHIGVRFRCVVPQGWKDLDSENGGIWWVKPKDRPQSK